MAGWKFGYHANCWGPLGGDAVGVTSIAGLTYRTFGPMKTAIAEIAEAGYEGVELFDGNLLERPVAELGDLLASHGLALVAVYSGANFVFDEILPEELDRIRRVADRAAEFGAPHLVVGGGAQRAAGPRDGDHAKLAAALEEVVRIAEKRGLTAHYHPHLTTIIEGPDEVRRILAETSMHFCPDTAHLAAAGGDPAAMIREHADRIAYVHLKGLRREPFAFTPLDEGDLDMGEVVHALEEIDYEGWVLTELDAWPDPKDGARRSRAFLERAHSAAT